MKYVFLILVLAGCSARYHLQRAIDKGARISTSTKIDTVLVQLPGDTILVALAQPNFDTLDFFETMETNDSLVLAGNRMEALALSNDALVFRSKQLQLERDVIRKKLMEGFYKDSTYTLRISNTETVIAKTVKGILKELTIQHSDSTIVVTTKCPETKISAGFSWLQLIGCFILGAFLSLIISKLFL